MAYIFKHRLLKLGLILCGGIIVLWSTYPQVRAQTGLQFEPSPTPIPPLSSEAELALKYLSQVHAIPRDKLLIVNEQERSYILLNRSFRAFVILDTQTPQSPSYQLLVDKQTQEVIEDVVTVQREADIAYRQKYGKLHPELYERLQNVKDETLVPLAIWAAPGEAEKTEAEYFAILAAEFPEAARAIDSGSVPEDV